MMQLYLHPDAHDDLNALWQASPVAAARIIALLEELENDPDLLDRLTQHDFGTQRSERFHVSKWQEQWRQGKDLWRLKVWDLEDRGLRYRVVYAFIPHRQNYHVLGIAPRSFDYAPNHPFTQRILAAYAAL